MDLNNCSLGVVKVLEDICYVIILKQVVHLFIFFSTSCLLCTRNTRTSSFQGKTYLAIKLIHKDVDRLFIKSTFHLLNIF